jgi:predicted phage-related endonuclease
VKDNYWQWYSDDNPTVDGIIENNAKKKKQRFYMNIKSIIHDPKIGAHFRANVDGMIVPKRNSRTPTGILEAKSGLNWVWDQYKSGIPEFYVLQVQAYMLITGLSYAEIAVLLDGRYFKCYPFEANKEIHEAILDQVNEFWELVKEGRIIWDSELPEHERLQRLSNIEPEIDGSDALDRYLKDRFKTSYKAGQMQITPEIKAYGLEYIEKSLAAKEAEKPKKMVGQLLRKMFIDNGVDEFVDDGKVIMSYRKISENKSPVLYVNKDRLTDLVKN